MEKDEFIDDLEIKGEQFYDDDGSYVTILDEQSWITAQVKLDTCNELEDDDEESNITYESSNLQYSNEYFILNLIADFESDTYKLIIKDR